MTSHHKQDLLSVIPRSVKDPIHDLITLSPRLCMFIDTKQFQRLRNIKQLGTSYYIWPGVSHNRFEHSIGVAFLARLMASHLQRNQPELEITDRDIECVEIAGLCHDLGHGPWSHVWDGMFIPRALPGSQWRHEEGSVMMLDYLIADNEIPMNDKDKSFIKALVSGDPTCCSPDEKPFLFDIVANKRNGLDVDKFDYILRDSHMTGDSIKIALPRIIKSARVLDQQICYDIKDANQLYEICATRFKLHKMVYNHKAARAIEYMIVDGILAAEPYLKIAEHIHKPDKYLHLTDYVMPSIEASEDPNLAPAQAIFDRLRNRDLYKMVDFKSIDWKGREVFEEQITPALVVEAAKALPDSSVVNVSGLQPQDVIVDFSVMHYGMKEKNPLDFVKFYSKRIPNESANAVRGDYSTLMPECHAEVLLRVYTKKPEFFGIVQAGYRACLAAVVVAAAVPAVLPTWDPPPLFFSTEEDAINFRSAVTSTTAPPPSVTDVVVGLVPLTSVTRSGVRVFSRNSSLTFGGGGGNAVGGGGLAPFSNNSFTTVSTNFVPSSPSRGNRRVKRPREVGQNKRNEEGGEGMTTKKTRSG